MALTRLWIDIQGDLIDIWHIKDVRKGIEMNQFGEYFYTVLLNQDAGIASEIKGRKYKFKSEVERDEVVAKIKKRILDAPGMYFLGENDNDLLEEMMEERRKRKERANDDGVDYEDIE